VEPKLLQVALALMQEHELGWDVISAWGLLLFIDFNREVPNCKLVVC
jgi:hypothetical protein